MMTRGTTAVRDARAASSADGRIDEASLVGMHIGDRYRLLELIGEGGMGGVFRAEQLATKRIVAVKLLHPELAHIEYVARRFQREAQAASRLSHPNVVEVLDFGESNGHLFLAMELLAGRSLTDAIDEGNFGAGGAGMLGRARRLLGGVPPGERIAQALAILRQILGALEHAHSRGVVHRDLKPENVMLLPPPSAFTAPHVKLLDFGIAKLSDDAPVGAKALTQAGIPLGTPQYMSPEQAAGDATDARSDIYACGVIAYEMLTGRLPFDAPSVVQLLSMQVTATPQPLRAVAPQARIPEALERVVLRALAKRREDRFASAAELRCALDNAVRYREYASAATVARPDAAAAVEPARPPRWMRAAVTMLAVGLATGVLADHHWAASPPAISGQSVAAAATQTVASAKSTNVVSAPACTTGKCKPSAAGAAKRRKPRAR